MRLVVVLLVVMLPTATYPAELLVIERDGCHWCARWNAEIAPIYPKTEEGALAPLRRVQITALPADVTLAARPVFTPTFVLIDEGRELGRIEGYAGDEFFWFLLAKLLDALPEMAAMQ